MRPIEKYLDEVKNKAGIKTDCELSKKLGIKQPSLVKIRNGENTPSEETCKRLSEIAKDPYEKVLLLAQVSKASETSKNAWEHILKAASKAGLFTLLLTLFLMSAPTLAQASTPSLTSSVADAGYYVK